MKVGVDMNNEVIKDLVNLVDLRALIHYSSQKELSQKQINNLRVLVEESGNKEYITMFNKQFKQKNEELGMEKTM